MGCLGAGLWLLKRTLPHRPEENLSELWEYIKVCYRRDKTPCRMSYIKKSMIDGDPWPRLKAKAVETKYLIWPLCCWLNEHKGVDADLNAMFRLSMISHRLDELLDKSTGWCLTTSESQLFRQGLFTFCQELTRLCWRCHNVGLPYFAFTIKHHYLLHLGLLPTGHLSPKAWYCYGGEDFMGKIKHLCISCLRGLSNHRLMNKVAKKYLWALDMVLASEE